MSRSHIYGLSANEAEAQTSLPDNSELEKFKAYADRIYNEVKESNKVEADKKKEQMEQFNSAIDFACFINDIRLFIYYDNLIEKFVETSKLEDIKMAEARQHLAELANDSHSPRVDLPTEKQSLDTYKDLLLTESQQAIQELNTKIDVVEERIKAATQILYDKFDKDINEGKFLNVIKMPAGKTLNVSAADLEIAKAEHRNVNKALREFLLEMKPPEPDIVVPSDDKVVLGADVPLAPAAPVDFIAPTKISTSKTQMEKDVEVFHINLLREAWDKIGQQVSQSIVLPVMDKTAKLAKLDINLNSNLRLAMREAKEHMQDIKALFEKGGHFIQDKINLGNLKAAKNELEKPLELNLEAEKQTTNKRRR